jgi:hypothetical protein
VLVSLLYGEMLPKPSACRFGLLPDGFRPDQAFLKVQVAPVDKPSHAEQASSSRRSRGQRPSYRAAAMLTARV